MKTVIMAGGKGRRIAELFSEIPKPLIPITNSDGVSKPVIEWEIESLASQGFKEIILTVSYMADKIQEYFGDGSKLGVDIQYFVEETPLGNAGALFKMRSKLTEPFLLLNADAIFDVDFNRMIEKHQAYGGLVTLFTHPNSHPYDSGLIVVDSFSHTIEQWFTKEDKRSKYYKNRVNAGLHIIDPQILDLSEIDTKLIGKPDENGKIRCVDLDEMLLKPLCGSGQMYAYDSPEYCKDMGTPERYTQVQKDFRIGVIEAKSLKNKQKAIFLDRDGTINKYVGFLRNINDFELIAGVAEAIKKINESRYLCIVITNQPVIARGEVTKEQLNEIHNKMETLLGFAGAYIDGLYYCPHHPNRGFEGEITELKIDCDCRKPKPGLILRATKDFNIDLGSSWMIGDEKSDIDCGLAVGCHTALLSSTENYGQEMTISSLLEAVDRIL